MKKTIYISILGMLLGLIALSSCTDLEEKIEDSILGEDLVKEGNMIQIASPPYAQLHQIYYFTQGWALSEASTEECMFAQRGTDWEDGGQWRQLYLHNWNDANPVLNDSWNYNATGAGYCDVALFYLSQFEQTDSVIDLTSQVRFLKCLYNYYFLDYWGQIPFREPGDFDYNNPCKVLNKEEGFAWLEKELKDLIDNNLLKDKDNQVYGRANKGAAQALLARLYINKKQFGGAEGDWTNTKAVCDAIINSGDYDFDPDYFHIFGIHNEDSEEPIFVVPFDNTLNGTATTSRGALYFYSFPLHYNQKYATGGLHSGGWNGPCVTPDFLDRLQVNGDTTLDKRYRSTEVVATCNGLILGFQAGQQYDGAGNALETRQTGTKLWYTRECPLIGAVEYEGVRVLKYAPDPSSPEARQSNDYVVSRYSDIWLMRVEANFRLGLTGDALTDINTLRTVRGIPALASITLEDIFNERRRELYWEGYARQDYIRFDKFLLPHYNKPENSSAARIWYAIPASAVNMNPNLKQNPI